MHAGRPRAPKPRVTRGDMAKRGEFWRRPRRSNRADEETSLTAEDPRKITGDRRYYFGSNCRESTKSRGGPLGGLKLVGERFRDGFSERRKRLLARKLRKPGATRTIISTLAPCEKVSGGPLVSFGHDWTPSVPRLTRSHEKAYRDVYS